MTDITELDPLPFLRSAREQLVFFHDIDVNMAKAIPGAQTNLQADEQAFSEAMSVGLRGAVNSYAETHPDIGLQLLHYTRTVDNEPRLVLDAAVDAPDEEAIVQLTSAVSSADRDAVTVVAEILIAARTKG